MGDNNICPHLRLIRISKVCICVWSWISFLITFLYFFHHLNRMFFKAPEREFRIFFKEYSSSLQKASLLLPLIISTITWSEVIWFKYSFKTFRLLYRDVSTYPHCLWLILSNKSWNKLLWMNVYSAEYFFSEVYLKKHTPEMHLELLCDFISLYTDFSFTVFSSDWDRFGCTALLNL